MVFGAVMPGREAFSMAFSHFLDHWSGPVGSVGEHTRGSVPSPDRAIGDPSASPRDFAWRCGIAIEMLSILYGSICDRCDLDVHRRSDAYTRLTVAGAFGWCVRWPWAARWEGAGRARSRERNPNRRPCRNTAIVRVFSPKPNRANASNTHSHRQRHTREDSRAPTPGRSKCSREYRTSERSPGRSECSAMPLRNGGSAQARPSQQSE
jgi:hypothetical protein